MSFRGINGLINRNKKSLITDYPIFIGGEGRSGTTLMRVILDSHQNISCGPEAQLFRDPKLFEFYDYTLSTYKKRISEYNDEPNKYLAKSFVAMYDAFLGEYARSKGKKRWAEKSPHNILVIDELAKLFNEELRFIHLIRDGRDVACSILSMKWGPTNIRDAATRWKKCIDAGKKHRGKEYYMEVKYEDLISKPEKQIKKVFKFIDEKYSKDLVEYYKKPHDLGNESSSKQVTKPIHKKSMQRWKSELSKDDLKIFYEIAGDTLDELNYKE